MSALRDSVGETLTRWLKATFGVLRLKTFRTMWRNRGQTVAVIAVVLCGIATYVCMNSAYLNLSLTRDTYYETYRLADFEIRLDRAPRNAVHRIAELDGVRKAQGRIVEDVNVDVPNVDEPRVGRLISLPTPRRPVIDDIVIMKGRFFEAGAQSEVILSKKFAESNNLDLGDTIEVSIENKKYPLHIVGLGLSPEYVYMIRNVQALIPEPEKFGVLWVSQDFAESALDMAAACNSIVGMVDDPEQLDAILDRADALLDPYGVFAKVKQDEQISYRFLDDEIKGLGVSARVVPTLFLGIASLILLVLLNRMVRAERTQIGLLKAYGYSNLRIAAFYLEYALLLSVVGCFFGFLIGHWLSIQMVEMYVMFYEFPLLEARVYPDVLARSVALAIVFAVLGALAAAVRAARINPAESMRPEAPSQGSRVGLKALTFIWRRLSFSWKMIFRNVYRNKWRAALNAFGVAISLAFLIMGFFMMDAMDFGLRFQFQEVQREDVKIGFQGERGKQALYEVQRFPHVRRAEPVLEYPFEMRAGWRTKDIVVIGIQDDAELQKVLNFKGEEVSLSSDGVVLTDRLAEEMQVAPGDTITLEPLMGRVDKVREVPVHSITEQFLGMSAYMEIGGLSRLLNEPVAMNAALLRIEEDGQEALNEELKDIAAIAAVVFTVDAYQALLDTIAMSAKIMNTTVLIFAGIIAFAIIYNITAVALAERQRELASLRVMGLTQQEVGAILYNENFVLGIVGCIAGVPLGILICKLLVDAYSNDLYRLPFHISEQTYAVSILLTLLFIALANLAVWRKIQKLDLIEVLKERE